MGFSIQKGKPSYKMGSNVPWKMQGRHQRWFSVGN